MDDVQSRGSLPVPKHLASATYRERRDFGTGVGYVYPQDFEGADVGQQYLPDALVGRHYYRPTDEGYEKLLGERMEARQLRREQAAAAGGPTRRPGNAAKTDAMKVAGGVMRQRETRKRSTAERQKREASDQS